MNTNQQNKLFGLFLIALVFLIIEGLSYLVFTRLEPQLRHRNPTKFVLVEKKISQLINEGIFDSDLGWSPNSKSALHERTLTTSFKKPFMATYGDSFTYGDGVNDGETWQSFLGTALKADIYNFGVGGYGTDQAYLRFKKFPPPSGTSIVALGFMLKNLNRLVSVYRPFYIPETGIPLTKPHFKLIEGKLVLIPNPIQNTEEIQKLNKKSFIEEIGQYDYWFLQQPYIRFFFPYSALLFNPEVWLQAIENRFRRLTELESEEKFALWKSPDHVALFLAVLDIFSKEVLISGRQPIFLIFPTRADIKRSYNSLPVPGLDLVLEHCKAKHYKCFDGIRAFSSDYLENPDSSQLTRVLFQEDGHLTRDGNKKFADELKKFMRSYSNSNRFKSHKK